MRESFRSSFLWNLANSGFLLCAGALSGVLSARFLGPEGKGLWSFYFSIAGWITMLSSLSTDTATTYFTAQGNAYETIVENVRKHVLLGTFLAFTIGIALWFFGTGIFPQLRSIPSGMYALLLLYVPVMLTTNHFNCIFAGWLRYRISSIASMLIKSLEILGLIAVIVFWNAQATGLIVTTWIASVAGLLFLWMNLRRSRQVPHGSRVEDIFLPSLRYGLSSYGALVAQTISYRFDVFLITYFLGAKDLGYYTVAVALAELGWHVPQAFSTVIFSRIASNLDQNQKIPSRIAMLSMFLAAILGVVYFGLGDRVIAALFGDRFHPAFGALRAIVPGIVFLAGAKPLAAFIAGTGRVRWNFHVSLVSACVNIVGNLVLIPKYGIQGAALSSSLSYGCSFVLSSVLYRKLAS